MIDVLVIQWIASLFGMLSAIAVSHACGGGDPRTTLCILVVAGLAGRLFRKMRPTVTIRTFISGSVLYLLSLVILLVWLGHLELGTAQAIANWYNQQGIGPSVGFLIMQWAFVPLPFWVAAWPRQRSRNS